MLQRLFCKLDKLDGQALSAVLRAHFAPLAVPVPTSGEAPRPGVAVDGKAQRGRLPFHFQQGGCPVPAPSAFCHEHGVVLAPEPITHGADKAEAERTVAPPILARVAWSGRVLTGDALFCQRPVPTRAQRRRRLSPPGQGEPTAPLGRYQPALRSAARSCQPPPCWTGARPRPGSGDTDALRSCAI